MTNRRSQEQFQGVACGLVMNADGKAVLNCWDALGVWCPKVKASAQRIVVRHPNDL